MCTQDKGPPVVAWTVVHSQAVWQLPELSADGLYSTLGFVVDLFPLLKKKITKPHLIHLFTYLCACACLLFIYVHMQEHAC